MLVLLLGGLAGCPASKPSDNDASRSSSATATASPGPTTPDACPGSYIDPDPERPRITLSFSVDSARRLVTGSESVVFTPDLPITELVFRLWPNGPTASPGTRLDVTAARTTTPGTAPVKFRTESAGGRPGTQGTLLHVPLGRTVPAGDSVSATVDFRLSLGKPIYERWGTTGATAWWGTGHPLLAWVRGTGWQTAPAGKIGGEYAASEAARYEVTVDADDSDTVLGSGVADDPVTAGPGRRRWRIVNLTARDFTAVVGTFRTVEDEVAGVPVTAAVSADTAARPDVLRDQIETAIGKLTKLFGPYPYRQLTVVAVPSFGSGGIEYPGFFYVGPELNPTAVTHEAAHEWFYGLVGDDQARHPWLDEAFATYAEALANEKANPYPNALTSVGAVDSPTASFGTAEFDYARVVYGKGASALLAARQRAGAAGFDRALRCYLNANAWRVVDPADVRAAFAELPAAVATLHQAGAL